MSLAVVILLAVTCALLLGALCEWLTYRPIRRTGPPLLKKLPCGAKVLDLSQKGTAVASLESAFAVRLDKNVDRLSESWLLECSRGYWKCRVCPGRHAEREPQAFKSAKRREKGNVLFSG